MQTVASPCSGQVRLRKTFDGIPPVRHTSAGQGIWHAGQREVVRFNSVSRNSSNSGMAVIWSRLRFITPLKWFHKTKATSFGDYTRRGLVVCIDKNAQSSTGSMFDTGGWETCAGGEHSTLNIQHRTPKF